MIVDKYFRFTWVSFLTYKDETFLAFQKFYKRVLNEKNTIIISIRSDHGSKFNNHHFENFCNEKGIDHNFLVPRIPQQNGIVERKNRILKEIARNMLCESNLPKYFWAEAINTSYYILNRALIRPILKKIPYELWKDRKLNISYFYIFGCRFFIHNNSKDNLKKFDAKLDEDIFLGYSTSNKTYRVFNKRTLIIEESIYIVFDESNGSYLRKDTEDEKGILENKINKLNLNESSNEEIGTNNFEETTIE